MRNERFANPEDCKLRTVWAVWLRGDGTHSSVPRLRSAGPQVFLFTLSRLNGPTRTHSRPELKTEDCESRTAGGTS